MLRYECCFPEETIDATRITQTDRTRRIVLCRRGSSEEVASLDRWRSFGWPVLLASKDPQTARTLADARPVMVVTAKGMG